MAKKTEEIKKDNEKIEIDFDTSGMNVYEKLQKARSIFLNILLKKTGKNNNLNFEYFELSDFMPDTISLFEKLKLFHAFNLYAENATLTIINIERSELDSETITFETPVIIAQMGGKTDKTIQGLGATHTYLKRYLYLNALELTEFDSVNRMLNESIFREKLDSEKAAIYIEKHMKEFRLDIENYISEKNTTLQYMSPDELIELAGFIKGLKGGGKNENAG